MKDKLLYIFISIFILLLTIFFIIEKEYVTSSNTYYTNSIKQEIQILINTKKQSTFEIAKNLAINKKLINIIKQNKYAILYDNPHFFPIHNDYKTFKNIGVAIIDNKGFIRYRSWSKKRLNENVLKYRPDIAEFLKNPKPKKSIITGMFDIAFKATIPVFDKNHNLLAALEVTTHFNSIINRLKTQHVYSTIILTKERSKLIKFTVFGDFVNEYFISPKLYEPIKDYINEKTIKRFISIKPNKFDYIVRHDDLFDGYFIISIPIIDNNITLGYFIAFIKDTYLLEEKEVSLNIIMLIITILFLIIAYIAYKKTQENKQLINSLNHEVQIQINEKLKLIYQDPLTHAYKKTKFEIDKLTSEKKYVIMLNIKNFSKINELYGFQTGDEILKIVTKRIERYLEDSIYRINADEFVFFSDNYRKDINYIQKLFVNDPIKLHDINLRLSFSFAVTKNDKYEILRKLSIALKEAKTKPFRSFIYYKTKKTNTDFLKFNSLLYDAIFIHEKAEIVPYFQAIIDNKTNTIIKYEALARLKTNETTYSPYFFIDIAKNSGFLFEITKIMIDKSFAKIANTDLNLSINITEDDLLTFQLKPYLTKKLLEYNLKAEQITLEILEGITSAGTKNNIKQLKELKKIGFSLAIDDFGVEYSNFERINELDVDYIKIDGKYIKNLPSNSKSYEITKAITQFAHSLEIKVIAEFVEDENILNKIKELNIEYSQGYYFAKPKEDI